MQRQATQKAETVLPIIDKYARLSAKRDEVKRRRSELLPEIENSLRSAVATYPYMEAVEIASKFDGLICMRVLIACVEELKRDYETKLVEKYQLQTAGIADFLERKFETFLDRIVEQIQKKRRGNVTQAEIDGVIQEITSHYWKQISNVELKQHSQNPAPEFCRLIKNYAFLVSASKVYRETDDMQMLEISLANAAGLVRAFKMPKEKMVESYQGLARCADQLVLGEGEKAKWGQISVWLYGLYNRVYRAIDPKYIVNGEVVKDSKGNYPTVDEEDKRFLKHKGITKFYMSRINLEQAVKLAAFLGLNLGNRGDLHLNTAAAAANPAIVSSAIPSPAVAASDSDQMGEIQCRQLPDGREGWCITLPVSLEDKVNKLAIVNQSVHTVESSVDKKTLINELAKVTHASAEDKIIWLSFCLSKFALDTIQVQSLAFLAREVKTAFEAYRRKSRLLSMTHAGKADVAEKRIENASGPKEWIQILLELRLELIATRSNSLLDEVNKLLLSAFTQLVNSSPSLSSGTPALFAVRPAMNRQDITCNVVTGGNEMCIEVKVYDADKKDRLMKLIHAALWPPHLDDEKLPLALAELSHSTSSDKIIRLHTCIFTANYTLTAAQSESLGFIAEEVKARFSAYRYTPVFFSMTHSEESKVAEEAIERAAGDPKLQLDILWQLRDELKSSNSDHLIREVEAVLMMAFNQLVRLLPVPALTSAARMVG